MWLLMQQRLQGAAPLASGFRSAAGFASGLLAEPL
jgi:hypothetical protein